MGKVQPLQLDVQVLGTVEDEKERIAQAGSSSRLWKHSVGTMPPSFSTKLRPQAKFTSPWQVHVPTKTDQHMHRRGSPPAIPLLTARRRRRMYSQPHAIARAIRGKLAIPGVLR